MEQKDQWFNGHCIVIPTKPVTLEIWMKEQNERQDEAYKQLIDRAYICSVESL